MIKDHIIKRLSRDVGLNQRSKLRTKLFIVTSTTGSLDCSKSHNKRQSASRSTKETLVH